MPQVIVARKQEDFDHRAAAGDYKPEIVQAVNELDGKEFETSESLNRALDSAFGKDKYTILVDRLSVSERTKVFPVTITEGSVMIQQYCSERPELDDMDYRLSQEPSNDYYPIILSLEDRATKK